MTVECDKDSAANYMCAAKYHNLIPKLSPAEKVRHRNEVNSSVNYRT